MKKDKDYRVRVVLIGMIILLIIGNTGETKKEAAVSQSTCDLANTHKDGCSIDKDSIINIGDDLIDCMPRSVLELGGPTDGSKETCIANQCEVGTLSVTGLNTYVCWSLVPNGWRTDNINNCENDGLVIDPTDSEYGVLCRAYASGVDPSTRDCNAAMEGIASMVQEFMPDMGCRTAFYMTIFGGSIMLLMIFAAM